MDPFGLCPLDPSRLRHPNVAPSNPRETLDIGPSFERASDNQTGASLVVTKGALDTGLTAFERA